MNINFNLSLPSLIYTLYIHTSRTCTIQGHMHLINVGTVINYK